MRHDFSTQEFEAFRREARESFSGQDRWLTQHALQRMLKADSEQQMGEVSRFGAVRTNGGTAGAGGQPQGSANGTTWRRCAQFGCRCGRPGSVRSSHKGIATPQRRAPEVAELIRQAFERGDIPRWGGPRSFCEPSAKSDPAPHVQ